MRYLNTRLRKVQLVFLDSAQYVPILIHYYLHESGGVGASQRRTKPFPLTLSANRFN